MKVELLYPEICNLYGESCNGLYLRKCFGDEEVIQTHLTQEPYFNKHEVSLVYMGAFAEFREEEVIRRLMPYRERILELIKEGTVFVVTGNAMDIFGAKIISKDKVIEGLNIHPYEVYMDMNTRRASAFLGEFNGHEIVGYKLSFTTTSGFNSKTLFKIIRGRGNDGKDEWEGVRINNFFGTYLIGPLLVMNPYFTEELLKLAGYEGELPYKEELAASYEYRLQQFKMEGAHTDLGFHGV